MIVSAQKGQKRVIDFAHGCGLLVGNWRNKQAVWFQAIARSMSDPRRTQDPSLRKEYWRLISTACTHYHLFDAHQRAQLEVYQIWAVLISEMQTDDNFAFNRVLKKIQVRNVMSLSWLG